MAELSLQDVIDRIDGIEKKFDERNDEINEIKTEVRNVSKQVSKHERTIFGEAESIDLKSKGLVGAIIEMAQQNKTNTKYLAIFITILQVIGLIVVSIIQSGGQ